MPVKPNAAKPPVIQGDNSQLDPLTGFHQQDYLNQVLNQTIHKNKQGKVVASLALLQLENFYDIKTWLGKSEATLFLSDIAGLIKKSLPATVLLSRCERDEFAALLFDQSSENSRLIADKIQRVIEDAAKEFLPAKLKLKISIGIAAMDARTSSTEVMYARARHDMCAAKERSPLRHWPTQNLDPETVFVRLKAALDSGQLRPVFQAIVGLKTEPLQHYEIRTHIEDRQGVIPATLLFELAVQHGWGDALDRWLIQNAVRVLNRTSIQPVKLVVNVTHNSIVSSTFFPWLRKLLGNTATHGQSLVFQVSEIDVLIAQHHISHFCRQLDELDIQTSINHFGCTDNPFRYLDLVRAKFVKLDSAAMLKTVIAHDSAQNLTSMVEKLHDNGLRVIVGKVEKMTEMPTLWSSNVNYVQGYALHRPSRSLNYEFLQESTLQLH